MGVKNNLTFQPLYEQVKASVLQRIIDGEWAPGTFLPSEPALAQEYGVSQGTMRRALDDLTRDNRLTRYQGKGTAVSILDEDKALFQFFHIVNFKGERVFPSSHILTAQPRKAEPEDRARLGINPGEMVFSIHRIRLINDIPVINEKVHMPLAFFPGIEAVPPSSLPNTLYAFYQQRFNMTISSSSEYLGATEATKSDAEHLNIPELRPLLRIVRISRNLEGNVVEYRESRVLTEQYSYLVELK